MRKKFLFSFILVLSFCVMLILPINLNKNNQIYALSEGKSMFYAQLNEQSKKFYNAFEKMKENDDFRLNKSYDLLKNSVLDTSSVLMYQNGNSQILKDFGAARDAFYLDNPKLFYVDFYKISLSLKTNGNEYFAYIDARRNNSFLLGYENFVELENDIESFNSVLREINLKISEKSTIKEKIIEANKILCDKSTINNVKLLCSFQLKIKFAFANLIFLN